MFAEPLHGALYFCDDAVEPRRRRQRVFNDGKIDTQRQQALGKEGESFLVVHLPVAAVDEREGRGFGRGSEEQIEPLARALAVRKIEVIGAFAPHLCAARRPVGDNRVALGNRNRVVVRGVQLRTIHSTVKHFAARFRCRHRPDVPQFAPSRAAAASTAPRRCAAMPSSRSRTRLTIAGGAVSATPASNGGAGAYSIPSWIAWRDSGTGGVEAGRRGHGW